MTATKLFSLSQVETIRATEMKEDLKSNNVHELWIDSVTSVFSLFISTVKIGAVFEATVKLMNTEDEISYVTDVVSFSTVEELRSEVKAIVKQWNANNPKAPTAVPRSELELMQALNPSDLYNKEIKFITLGDKLDRIAEHDPKWTTTATGSHKQAAASYKLLTIMQNNIKAQDLSSGSITLEAIPQGPQIAVHRLIDSLWTLTYKHVTECSIEILSYSRDNAAGYELEAESHKVDMDETRDIHRTVLAVDLYKPSVSGWHSYNHENFVKRLTVVNQRGVFSYPHTEETPTPPTGGKKTITPTDLTYGSVLDFNGDLFTIRSNGYIANEGVTIGLYNKKRQVMALNGASLCKEIVSGKVKIVILEGSELNSDNTISIVFDEHGYTKDRQDGIEVVLDDNKNIACSLRGGLRSRLAVKWMIVNALVNGRAEQQNEDDFAALNTGDVFTMILEGGERVEATKANDLEVLYKVSDRNAVRVFKRHWLVTSKDTSKDDFLSLPIGQPFECEFGDGTSTNEAIKTSSLGFTFNYYGTMKTMIFRDGMTCDPEWPTYPDYKLIQDPRNPQNQYILKRENFQEITVFQMVAGAQVGRTKFTEDELLTTYDFIYQYQLNRLLSWSCNSALRLYKIKHSFLSGASENWQADAKLMCINPDSLGFMAHVAKEQKLIPLIIRTKDAMDKTTSYLAKSVSCWWCKPEINNVLREAAKAGYVLFMSVTQVHWTDEGIKAFKQLKLI